MVLGLQTSINGIFLQEIKSFHIHGASFKDFLLIESAI